jgi:hydroxymethylglutaryl-CoA reductase (NADPH)
MSISLKKTASIPMKTIGPISITSNLINEEVAVPLATFESPLWPSVQRGARISQLCGGIQTTMLKEGMTRSILLEADYASELQTILIELPEHLETLQVEVSKTSRFAKLINYHPEVVGNLLYLRLNFDTGDAAGHNMATKASEAILNWFLSRYPSLRYVSISGNLCVDKKVSAINGILGRGKYVIAEMLIPQAVCKKELRSTPEKILNLHMKKNLIGGILAGSLRSSNAHFANMLLAFYLATGQDAANIVEGSQGITHVEIRDEDLYFSVTLPNLILGTMGNGKDLDFVQENLKNMGCLPSQKSGESAQRLAMICAATVFCGELSLLAAQTNPGELIDSHIRLERLGKKSHSN